MADHAGLRRRELLAMGVAALGAPGAALATAVVGGRAMAEDAKVLRRAYGLLHPGLHRYNTPAEMDGRFGRLDAALARAPDQAAAYVAFAELTAAVRCGHSYPNFYNQKKATAAALFEGRDKLPFQFCWLGRRMVVLRNLSSEPALARGAEVLAIDGAPVAAVFERLMKLSRADGHNDAKRARNLEVRGEDRFDAFDVYYPMVFRPRREGFRLRVRAPGQAAARTVEVAAMNHAERLAFVTTEETQIKGDQPLWRLQPGVGGAPAVLRMPTWAAYDSKWNWQADVDATFDRLVEERTPALIVDLRGNEGGSDIGNAIISRLIAHDVRPAPYHRWVRYRRTPTDLAPFLDTWDPSFNDWGNDVIGEPDTRGLMRLSRYDDDAGGDLITPRGRRYSGRVAVLIDASNSSATFQFVLAARRLGLATLVGQPTGGNLRGINGGGFFFLRLPNSGIEVDLPLIGYYADTPQPDAGILPDITVRPSLAEITAGEDMEMRAARAWLAAR